MSKQLWYPSKWYTEDYDPEYPEGGHGGTVVVSQGKVNPPIMASYGWNDDGECYAEIIEVREGTQYRNGTSIDDGVLDLGDIAYDSERVRQSDTEEEAVDWANEYSGGESDIVSDMCEKRNSPIPDEWVIFRGIVDASRDDHDTAQTLLKAHLFMWASAQE